MSIHILTNAGERFMAFLTRRIRFTRFVQNSVYPCLRNNARRRKVALVVSLVSEFEQLTGKKIYTDSFDKITSKRFLKFFEEKNYRSNTIRTLFSQIITILYMAKDRKYRIKNGLSEVMPKLDNTDTVYLTEEELKRLYAISSASFLEEERQVVLDIFLIGCYTALRYCDLITIRPENIVNGNILQKITKKTKERVTVPLHPVALAILEKYGYSIPVRKTSMQFFNLQIKGICRLAGITENIGVGYTQGGKLVRETLPKYELVSSHTARRTAVTILYLKGTPILSIMSISGHRSIVSLLTYIRVTQLEHLKILRRFICQSQRLPPAAPVINLEEFNKIQLDYLYHVLHKAS